MSTIICTIICSNSLINTISQGAGINLYIAKKSQAFVLLIKLIVFVITNGDFRLVVAIQKNILIIPEGYYECILFNKSNYPKC